LLPLYIIIIVIMHTYY